MDTLLLSPGQQEYLSVPTNLSNPGIIKKLPLLAPEQLVPADRFDEEGQEFTYMGREHFKTLLETYSKMRVGRNVIRIQGVIGGGKTRLLATFAAYLRYHDQPGVSNRRRVVYIPNCKKLLVEEHERLKQMKECLKFTFYDDGVSLKKINTFKKWVDLKHFVESQPKMSMVFVCDQWGALFIDDKDNDDVFKKLKTNTRLQLEALTYSQIRVEAISSGSQLYKQPNSSRDSDMIEMYVTGFLSDTEYNSWISNPNLFPAKLSEDVDALIKLSDLTGRIPLDLHRIYRIYNEISASQVNVADQTAQKSAGPQVNVADQTAQKSAAPQVNVDDIIQRYLNLLDVKLIGTRIRSYADGIFGRRDSMPLGYLKYKAMMMAALIETGVPGGIDSDLLDHRYFYDDNNIMRPASGLVRNIIADVMRQHSLQEYYATVMGEWVRGGLNSTNPCVRGFAYEEYVICTLIRSPNLFGIDGEINVKRFSDVSEVKKSLSYVKGNYLYWPIAYNHKYVDCVVRIVSGKRSRAGINETKLIAIQITLQEPAQHVKSYDFYKTGYYDNWKMVGEHPALEFLWSTQNKDERVPKCDACVDGGAVLVKHKCMKCE